MGKDSKTLLVFTITSIIVVGIIAWRKRIAHRRRIKRLKQGSVNIGGNF